jgi:hypothetical protein
MKKKFYITIILLLFSFYAFNQIHSNTLSLTRNCRNYIDIDNRYYINPEDNPDFVIANSDFGKTDLSNPYKIIPYVLSSEAELIIRSKKRGKKQYITCYMTNPKIRAKVNYSNIEGFYDVSLGLNHIKLKIEADGYKTYQVFYGNKFDLISKNDVLSNSSFESITDYIHKNRPDSILLTNITYSEERFELRTKDTVKIKLKYPLEIDPKKWCQNNERDTMLITGNFFKKSNPDTLFIEANECLYLRFDDDGTENDILIESINDSSKIFIREFCCGFPIPLLNSLELDGLYLVRLWGDGYNSGTIYLRIKTEHR